MRGDSCSGRESDGHVDSMESRDKSLTHWDIRRKSEVTMEGERPCKFVITVSRSGIRKYDLPTVSMQVPAFRIYGFTGRAPNHQGSAFTDFRPRIRKYVFPPAQTIQRKMSAFTVCSTGWGIHLQLLTCCLLLLCYTGLSFDHQSPAIKGVELVPLALDKWCIEDPRLA
jgi:hypothetical protein